MIPLSSDLIAIIKAAEEFKEFDENIIKNFDLILLNTMKIIFKLHSGLKESVYGDASRQQVCVPSNLNGGDGKLMDLIFRK